MKIRHVNFWWFKEPGNKDHARRLVEAIQALRDIPGVEEVHIGPRSATNWVGPDDTFDYGLTVVFESMDAVRAYLPHPIHQRAVEVSLEVGERFHSFYFEA